MNKKVQNTNNYSKIELGTFLNLTENIFQSSSDFKLNEKKFVKDDLGLTNSEISFNTMEVNTAIPFLHKHKENEEIYIAVKRKGQLLLNDNYVDIDMEEGTIVRVATDTERAIRNNSDAFLSFLS